MVESRQGVSNTGGVTVTELRLQALKLLSQKMAFSSLAFFKLLSSKELQINTPPVRSAPERFSPFRDTPVSVRPSNTWFIRHKASSASFGARKHFSLASLINGCSAGGPGSDYRPHTQLMNRLPTDRRIPCCSCGSCGSGGSGGPANSCGSCGIWPVIHFRIAVSTVC